MCVRRPAFLASRRKGLVNSSFLFGFLSFLYLRHNVVHEAFSNTTEGITYEENVQEICDLPFRRVDENMTRCWKRRESDINKKNVLPFAGAHRGKTAVLLCTGPSLENYSHEKLDERGEDVIIVGVNGVVGLPIAKKHGLDYLFVQDSGRLNPKKGLAKVGENRDLFRNFQCRKQKWYGTFKEGMQIGPDDRDLREGNATWYEVAEPECGIYLPLVYDIGNYVFGGSCTVALSALQFILYTQVSKVRLVGCDVTDGYAYDNESSVTMHTTIAIRQQKSWERAATFLKHYYPSTEIEVVRPVGLRGMFD